MRFMALRMLALAAIVAAAPASAASSRSDRTVIRLVSTATSIQEHDVAPKGTSAGDWVAGNDKLTNAAAQFGKPKGALVGSDRAVFRYVRQGLVTLTGTAKLPDGNIRTKGRVRVRSGSRYVIPVVGGTGHYASARGSVTVTNMSKDGKVTLNVYTLNL